MALVINIFLLYPLIYSSSSCHNLVFRNGSLVPSFVYTIVFLQGDLIIVCNVLYSTLLHLPPYRFHNSYFSLEQGLRPKICSYYTLYTYGLRYCFCASVGKLVYTLATSNYIMYRSFFICSCSGKKIGWNSIQMGKFSTKSDSIIQPCSSLSNKHWALSSEQPSPNFQTVGRFTYWEQFKIKIWQGVGGGGVGVRRYSVTDGSRASL